MTRIANRTTAAFRQGQPGAVVRRTGDGLEMVNLHWGLRPRHPDDPEARPFTVIGSEGRVFASHRCLLPASEFYLHHKKARWRFTLADGDHFYFAGIWRPASCDWPESYAVLTTQANEDVAPYHDRQMAVVRRHDRMAWLDHSRPEAELLRPLPPRSFLAEAEGSARLLL